MTPDDRTRMLKFLRLLASDQDGERGNAASMANKLAEKLGGWEKIMAPAGEPSWPARPTNPRASDMHDSWAYTSQSDPNRWARWRDEAKKQQEYQERAKSEAREQKAREAGARPGPDYDPFMNYSNNDAGFDAWAKAVGMKQHQWTEKEMKKIKELLAEKMKKMGGI